MALTRWKTGRSPGDGWEAVLVMMTGGWVMMVMVMVIGVVMVMVTGEMLWQSIYERRGLERLGPMAGSPSGKISL